MPYETSLMVGYRGELYLIDEDFQVGQLGNNYAAIGVGGPFALGSLHETKNKKPEKRILRALAAAEEFSGAVCGPFSVAMLPKD